MSNSVVGRNPNSVFKDPIDGKFYTRVSSDGKPIPVTFTAGTPFVEYGSVSSVANGISTTVLSYTVPAGKTLLLSKVEVSGCNVAEYSVTINAVTKGVRRTYWGNFNADFEYNDLSVATGLVVLIKVIHNRPLAGDFDATLIGALL